MSTDGITSGGFARSGRSGSGELAEQYWTTMARTADLVRKLTALADRYEAAIPGRGAHAEDSRQRVALMRRTAEAGRQLIRAQAPVAFPTGEQPAVSPLERSDGATSRDVRAVARDAAAEGRDQRATQRDARIREMTGDGDVDFCGRFLSACDRDAAAGDRADALADRRAAQIDREGTPPSVALEGQARMYSLVTRLEERALVRQAQGVLMERAGLTAGEAFEALLLAATGPMTLDAVADHVLRQAELPASQDAT